MAWRSLGTHGATSSQQSLGSSNAHDCSASKLSEYNEAYLHRLKTEYNQAVQLLATAHVSHNTSKIVETCDQEKSACDLLSKVICEIEGALTEMSHAVDANETQKESFNTIDLIQKDWKVLLFLSRKNLVSYYHRNHHRIEEPVATTDTEDTIDYWTEDVEPVKRVVKITSVKELYDLALDTYELMLDLELCEIPVIQFTAELALDCGDIWTSKQLISFYQPKFSLLYRHYLQQMEKKISSVSVGRSLSGGEVATSTGVSGSSLCELDSEITTIPTLSFDQAVKVVDVMAIHWHIHSLHNQSQWNKWLSAVKVDLIDLLPVASGCTNQPVSTSVTFADGVNDTFTTSGIDVEEAIVDSGTATQGENILSTLSQSQSQSQLAPSHGTQPGEQRSSRSKGLQQAMMLDHTEKALKSDVDKENYSDAQQSLIYIQDLVDGIMNDYGHSDESIQQYLDAQFLQEKYSTEEFIKIMKEKKLQEKTKREEEKVAAMEEEEEKATSVAEEAEKETANISEKLNSGIEESQGSNMEVEDDGGNVTIEVPVQRDPLIDLEQSLPNLVSDRLLRPLLKSLTSNQSVALAITTKIDIMRALLNILAIVSQRISCISTPMKSHIALNAEKDHSSISQCLLANIHWISIPQVVIDIWNVLLRDLGQSYVFDNVESGIQWNSDELFLLLQSALTCIRQSPCGSDNSANQSSLLQLINFAFDQLPRMEAGCGSLCNDSANSTSMHFVWTHLQYLWWQLTTIRQRRDEAIQAERLRKRRAAIENDDDYDELEDTANAVIDIDGSIIQTEEHLLEKYQALQLHIQSLQATLQNLSSSAIPASGLFCMTLPLLRAIPDGIKAGKKGAQPVPNASHEFGFITSQSMNHLVKQLDTMTNAIAKAHIAAAAAAANAKNKALAHLNDETTDRDNTLKSLSELVIAPQVNASEIHQMIKQLSFGYLHHKLIKNIPALLLPLPSLSDTMKVTDMISWGCSTDVLTTIQRYVLPYRMLSGIVSGKVIGVSEDTPQSSLFLPLWKALLRSIIDIPSKVLTMTQTSAKKASESSSNIVSASKQTQTQDLLGMSCFLLQALTSNEILSKEVSISILLEPGDHQKTDKDTLFVTLDEIQEVVDFISYSMISIVNQMIPLLKPNSSTNGAPPNSEETNKQKAAQEQLLMYRWISLLDNLSITLNKFLSFTGCFLGNSSSSNFVNGEQLYKSISCLWFTLSSVFFSSHGLSIYNTIEAESKQSEKAEDSDEMGIEDDGATVVNEKIKLYAIQILPVASRIMLQFEYERLRCQTSGQSILPVETSDIADSIALAQCCIQVLFDMETEKTLEKENKEKEKDNGSKRTEVSETASKKIRFKDALKGCSLPISNVIAGNNTASEATSISSGENHISELHCTLLALTMLFCYRLVYPLNFSTSMISTEDFVEIAVFSYQSITVESFFLFQYQDLLHDVLEEKKQYLEWIQKAKEVAGAPSSAKLAAKKLSKTLPPPPSNNDTNYHIVQTYKEHVIHRYFNSFEIVSMNLLIPALFTPIESALISNSAEQSLNGQLWKEFGMLPSMMIEKYFPLFDSNQVCNWYKNNGINARCARAIMNIIGEGFYARYDMRLTKLQYITVKPSNPGELEGNVASIGIRSTIAGKSGGREANSATMISASRRKEKMNEITNGAGDISGGLSSAAASSAEEDGGEDDAESDESGERVLSNNDYESIVADDIAELCRQVISLSEKGLTATYYHQQLSLIIWRIYILMKVAFEGSMRGSHSGLFQKNDLRECFLWFLQLPIFPQSYRQHVSETNGASSVVEKFLLQDSNDFLDTLNTSSSVSAGNSGECSSLLSDRFSLYGEQLRVVSAATVVCNDTHDGASPDSGSYPLDSVIVAEIQRQIYGEMIDLGVVSNFITTVDDSDSEDEDSDGGASDKPITKPSQGEREKKGESTKKKGVRVSIDGDDEMTKHMETNESDKNSVDDVYDSYPYLEVLLNDSLFTDYKHGFLVHCAFQHLHHHPDLVHVGSAGDTSTAVTPRSAGFSPRANPIVGAIGTSNTSTQTASSNSIFTSCEVLLTQFTAMYRLVNDYLHEMTLYEQTNAFITRCLSKFLIAKQQTSSSLNYTKLPTLWIFHPRFFPTTIVPFVEEFYDFIEHHCGSDHNREGGNGEYQRWYEEESLAEETFLQHILPPRASTSGATNEDGEGNAGTSSSAGGNSGSSKFFIQYRDSSHYVKTVLMLYYLQSMFEGLIVRVILLTLYQLLSTGSAVLSIGDEGSRDNILTTLVKSIVQSGEDSTMTPLILELVAKDRSRFYKVIDTAIVFSYSMLMDISPSPSKQREDLLRVIANFCSIGKSNIGTTITNTGPCGGNPYFATIFAAKIAQMKLSALDDRETDFADELLGHIMTSLHDVIGVLWPSIRCASYRTISNTAKPLSNISPLALPSEGEDEKEGYPSDRERLVSSDDTPTAATVVFPQIELQSPSVVYKVFKLKGGSSGTGSNTSTTAVANRYKLQALYQLFSTRAKFAVQALTDLVTQKVNGTGEEVTLALDAIERTLAFECELLSPSDGNIAVSMLDSVWLVLIHSLQGLREMLIADRYFIKAQYRLVSVVVSLIELFSSPNHTIRMNEMIPTWALQSVSTTVFKGTSISSTTVSTHAEFLSLVNWSLALTEWKSVFERNLEQIVAMWFKLGPLLDPWDELMQGRNKFNRLRRKYVLMYLRILRQCPQQYELIFQLCQSIASKASSSATMNFALNASIECLVDIVNIVKDTRCPLPVYPSFESIPSLESVCQYWIAMRERITILLKLLERWQTFYQGHLSRRRGFHKGKVLAKCEKEIGKRLMDSLVQTIVTGCTARCIDLPVEEPTVTVVTTESVPMEEEVMILPSLSQSVEENVASSSGGIEPIAVPAVVPPTSLEIISRVYKLVDGIYATFQPYWSSFASNATTATSEPTDDGEMAASIPEVTGAELSMQLIQAWSASLTVRDLLSLTTVLLNAFIAATGSGPSGVDGLTGASSSGKVTGSTGGGKKKRKSQGQEQVSSRKRGSSTGSTSEVASSQEGSNSLRPDLTNLETDQLEMLGLDSEEVDGGQIML